MTTISRHQARPAIIASSALLIYLLLVLLPFQAKILIPSCIAACFVVVWLLGELNARSVMTRAQFSDVATLCTAILLSMLAMDIIYTAYDTYRAGDIADGQSQEYLQKSDSNLNGNRLVPPTWYPGTENFFLFKPGVSQSGYGYGSFYDATLLGSPLIRNEVLELRTIDYRIDDNGFREQTLLSAAAVYCLGDSYTFGHGIGQDSNWVERLERRIDQPVYNLGMPATSPGQQVQLLRYFLEQHKEAGIRHLLWMIFEGNDLTDAYASVNPLQKEQGGMLKNVAKKTVLGEPFYLVKKLRKQSVLHSLFNGDLVFSWPDSRGVENDPFVTEGVRTRYPVYHSGRFGARMFRNFYITVAGHTQESVEQHPNRAKLEQAFMDMAALAGHYDFDVTVLIAPSAPRLHAQDFEELPAVSDQPYFINLVKQIAGISGFKVLDLNSRLQPYARQELLYWRDDDHWNARGNEIVAGIVADDLFSDSAGN